MCMVVWNRLLQKAFRNSFGLRCCLSLVPAPQGPRGRWRRRSQKRNRRPSLTPRDHRDHCASAKRRWKLGRQNTALRVISGLSPGYPQRHSSRAEIFAFPLIEWHIVTRWNDAMQWDVTRCKKIRRGAAGKGKLQAAIWSSTRNLSGFILFRVF